MELVVRAALIYLALLILFRITGKRSLAQITPFDLILLLIIGEATQGALLGGDESVTAAFIVILTLIALDTGLSYLQTWFRFPSLLTDDAPLVIVQDGAMLEERARKNRVTIIDVLYAARSTQGLERVDQIKYAVLERTGEISVIPRRDKLGYDKE